MIEKLTVGQFQELYKVQKSDMDDLDKVTEMVAIISGKTNNEVDSMPVPEFNRLASEVTEAISKPLPKVEPKKIIEGVGITYEPAKLNRGQYVTVMHFMKGDVIENAHLILASISYNPKTRKHESDKHSEIAERLQDARMVDVYASCVFFCQLFNASMSSLENFLVKELLRKGMTKPQATIRIRALLKGLDGYTTLNRSQISRELA